MAERDKPARLKPSTLNDIIAGFIRDNITNQFQDHHK